jgi:hypothetical protein
MARPARLAAERLWLDVRSRCRKAQRTMSAEPRRNARKRIPPATRRRALELLAASSDGCTEAIMIAHGFTVEQMVELVRAGLASATAERVVAGRKAMEIARVRITEAGRRALTEHGS